MSLKDTWILLLIPLFVFFCYRFRRTQKLSSIRFSSYRLFKGIRHTPKAFLARNLIWIRIIAVILFVIALARPRIPLQETKRQAEGIDIVLTLDASGSMRAEDFVFNKKRYNRLDIVKKVVGEFIRKRTSDRIGVVAFAARAYTVCPLTLDYDWLAKNIARIELGTIEDGTAIGSAISSSLNRLKNTQAKSKIIILLTDGVNNAGKISPLTVASAAKVLGIKIYTIGAGTKESVPYPVQGFFGQKMYQNVKIPIDEDTLKKIAQTTGGMYFRATDTESLRDIYAEIDALEKTVVEETGFLQYQEMFPYFLLTGILLLLFEVVLSNTVLRSLP